jgi:hypothetical protein
MKPKSIVVGHSECVVNSIGHARLIELEKNKAIEQAEQECSEQGPITLSLTGDNASKRITRIEGNTGLPKEFKPLPRWTEEDDL